LRTLDKRLKSHQPASRNATSSTKESQVQPDSKASERMKRKPKLALRVNEENPNHHLWNNRGVWWCHLTVHKPDATAERLRFSLKTRDVDQARERRDRIFRQIAEHYEIAA
jgi:hypothetical protein